MKTELKYRIRRLIAAIILLAIFMTFTVSALSRGIDYELDRRDRVIREHQILWGVTE